jgi:hypothetical protein
MMFDDSLPDLDFGESGGCDSIHLGPPGLPPLVHVVSNPHLMDNKLSAPVRRWEKRAVGFSRSRWCPVEELGPSESTTAACEDDVVPDTIPDDIWQTHFRQTESDLSDKKEAEYILSLFRQCSGRWPVIYDRWLSHPIYGERGRPLESLKSKFFKVNSKLLEIDALQRNQPTNNSERAAVLSSVRLLLPFTLRYNEKNEFLRRAVKELQWKQTAKDLDEQQKMLAEITRLPTISIRKKAPKPTLPVGASLASQSTPSPLADLSQAEGNRVRAVLKALGLDRAKMATTPSLQKRFALIEREAHALIMLRDSLNRKRQELEILRTGGNSGSIMPGRIRVGQAPTTTIQLQQKRKR